MSKFKSGDLVIVVWSNRYPSTIGRVLTLTAPCAVHPDSWDTSPEVFPAESDTCLPMSFWEPTIRLVRGEGLLMKHEDLAPIEKGVPA